MIKKFQTEANTPLITKNGFVNFFEVIRPTKLKNSDFQKSFFSVKNYPNLSKKNSIGEYFNLGAQLLQKLFFDNFIQKKSFIPKMTSPNVDFFESNNFDGKCSKKILM